MKCYDNGVYREMTETEIMEIAESAELTAAQRINYLKLKLSKTDYKAIKYAEGLISDEDYATVKAERQDWRNEINALEAEVSIRNGSTTDAMKGGEN